MGEGCESRRVSRCEEAVCCSRVLRLRRAEAGNLRSKVKLRVAGGFAVVCGKGAKRLWKGVAECWCQRSRAERRNDEQGVGRQQQLTGGIRAACGCVEVEVCERRSVGEDCVGTAGGIG